MSRATPGVHPAPLPGAELSGGCESLSESDGWDELGGALPSLGSSGEVLSDGSLLVDPEVSGAEVSGCEVSGS